MDVNERIARALGWEPCPGAAGICAPLYGKPMCRFNALLDPREKRHASVPDYAHSLDACLHVRAALREKGWRFVLTDKLDGESWCCHGSFCRMSGLAGKGAQGD